MPDYAGLDRLQRALNPLPGAAVDGQHQMNVTGTVNIVGGGSGGTSMTDNAPFTPGSTAITPMGGYVSGGGVRAVGSGNAVAVALDASANLMVNVAAGGAGGGVANLTVRGSGNSDIHVGYRGGASVNSDGGAYVPISGTVNIVGGGGFASVGVFGTVGAYGTMAVYGSPANPIYNVGSVNVVNVVGITGSVSMAGSVNIAGQPISVTTASFIYADSTNSALRVNVVAGGAGGGVSNITVRGSGNTDIHVGYAGGASVNSDGGAYVPIAGSVNITGQPISITTASFIYADSTNSALRVNVVAGGAGGGVANLTVRGSGNTDIHVGYAGGASINSDGGAYMPISGTVNIVGGGSGFASVAVYGSPANPVYNVGSVNVVNNLGIFGSVSMIGSVNVAGSLLVGAIAPAGSINVLGSVNVAGSLLAGVIAPAGSLNVYGSVNITGSLNPVGVFGSMGVYGSVNIIAGSLNVINVPKVDTSASLSPSMWTISTAVSGNLAVVNAGSLSANPGNNQIKFYSITLVSEQTANMIFQSPSGTNITGSIQLLPGAGFVVNGSIKNPILIAGAGGTININSTGTGHIGGWAMGYVE